MSLTDEHGRPLTKEDDDKPNGKSKGGIRREQVDVRSIPTGTLLWNLYLASNAEQMLIGQIHQLQVLKQMQKMVNDPPQMQQLVADYQNTERERYTIAREVNARFRDMDLSRCARLNIELYDPAPQEVEDADGQ